MPSTAEKLIVKLSSVFAWAVENGLLSKTYDNKLELTNDIRKAFSQPSGEQANGLCKRSSET